MERCLRPFLSRCGFIILFSYFRMKNPILLFFAAPPRLLQLFLLPIFTAFLELRIADWAVSIFLVALRSVGP